MNFADLKAGDVVEVTWRGVYKYNNTFNRPVFRRSDHRLLALDEEYSAFVTLIERPKPSYAVGQTWKRPKFSQCGGGKLLYYGKSKVVWLQLGQITNHEVVWTREDWDLEFTEYVSG